MPDGEPGDLFIQGPSAALMYWGNRAKTRDTFQGGWTKSGDKYVRNADGTYTYSGRSDDMLKVSGIWVSPFEVEATLVQHPAVLEAAVIGLPDAEGLTKTKAYVVLKPGCQANDAELKAFVKDRLAPYKYPRVIEFIAELPKTATGKIQRFKLREQGSSAGPPKLARRPWGAARRAATERGRRPSAFARSIGAAGACASSTPRSGEEDRPRSSCSSTKASARSRCGATSPLACAAR